MYTVQYTNESDRKTCITASNNLFAELCCTAAGVSPLNKMKFKFINLFTFRIVTIYHLVFEHRQLLMLY